jgi:hypothetical protein
MRLKIIITKKINTLINIKIKEKKILKEKNIISWGKESKRRRKKMGLVLCLMFINNRVCSINRKVRTNKSRNPLKNSQNQIGDQYRVDLVRAYFLKIEKYLWVIKLLFYSHHALILFFKFDFQVLE